MKLPFRSGFSVLLLLSFFLALALQETVPIYPLDKYIYIAQSRGLTNPSTGTAQQSCLNGWNLAIDEANNATRYPGGMFLLDSRLIKMEVLEDAYVAASTANNTAILLNRGVLLLTGVAGSSNNVAALNVISQYEKQGNPPVPFLMPSAGATELYAPFKRSVVLMKPSYEDEAYAMVTYFVNQLQLTRIGIVYQDDTFGIPAYNGAKNTLSRMGMKLDCVAAFQRASGTALPDLSLAYANITRSNPEALILFATGFPASLFINMDLVQKKLSPNVVFFVPSVGGDVLQNLNTRDPQVLKRIHITLTAPLPDDPVLSVAANYRKAYQNLSPTWKSGSSPFECYTYGRFLVSILEKMKATSASSLAQFRKDFLDEVYKSPVVLNGGIRVGPYADDCSVKGKYACCNVGLRQLWIGRFSRSDGEPELAEGGNVYWDTCGSLAANFKTTILFGQSVNTGDESEKDFREGMKLAFQEKNENEGGINGRAVSTLSYDDSGDPAKRLKNFEELITKDKVIGLIAPIGANATLDAVDMCRRKNASLFAPISSHPSLRDTLDVDIINVMTNDVDEAAAMINFCDLKSLRNLMLVYTNSPFEGIPGRNATLQGIKGFNKGKVKLLLNLLGDVGVDPQDFNTTATQTIISSITSKNPQVVLMFGSPSILSLIPLIQSKISTVFLISSTITRNQELFFRFLNENPKSYQNIFLMSSIPLVSSFGNNTIQIYQKFLTAWTNQQQQKQKAGTVAVSSSISTSSQGFRQRHFEGYLIATIIMSMLERINGNITRESLKKAIEDVSYFDVYDFKLGPFQSCLNPEDGPGCGCNSGRHEIVYYQVQPINTNSTTPPKNQFTLSVDKSLPSFSFPTCGITFTDDAKVMDVGFLYEKQILDLGYTFLQDQARVKVSEQFADLIETSYFQNQNTTTKINDTMSNMVNKGVGIIITTFAGAEKVARDYAINYSNSIHVIQVDGNGFTNQTNPVSMTRIIPKIWQASYLTGMTAGYLTKKGRIGFVIGDRSSKSLSVVNAFVIGARKSLPGVVVHVVSIKQNETNEKDLGEGVSRFLMDKGVDIIGHAVNGDSIPRYVAGSTGMVGAIGWNNDQRIYIGENILTSAYYNFAPSYASLLKMAILNSNKKSTNDSFPFRIPNSTYYKGLEDGTVTIGFFSSVVPVNISKIIMAEKDSLITDNKPIICGPLRGRSNGNVVNLNPGQCLKDEEMALIDFLLDEGVVDEKDWDLPPVKIDYIDVSDPTGLALLIITCLLMFCTLITAVLVWINRKHRVMKAATLPFLFVILFGIIVGYSALIPWLVKPNDDACKVRPWLLVMGFDLLMHPLFLKTWRIQQIFDSASEMRSAGVNLTKMTIYLSVALTFDLVVLIVWTAVDPLTPKITSDKILSCDSNNIWLWLGLIFGWNGLLVAWGLYLAFRIRNVPGQFNESKPIVTCIYNTCVVVCIIIPILALFRTSAVGQVLLLAFALWIIFTVALISIFIVKVFQSSRIGSTESSAPKSTRGFSTSASIQN